MSTELDTTTTQPASQLVEAIRALVVEETRRTCEEMLADVQPTAAGDAEASAPLDMEKLAAEVSEAPALKDRMNQSVETGLRNVLPQVLQRLKQEIQERTAGDGGGGGGSIDMQAIVNSSELKEMLEGQFRQMLLYLTQDVLPKELAKLNAGG